MIDFLLKKHPEFLKKFREYSREGDVFCEAVDDYIKKKEIEIYPLSEKIQTTYNTSFIYNDNDFDITFSDASNFILAKNKATEDDGTKKAHIFIFNKIGRTKMNCHILDFKENPFPIDFLPTGIGSVEHFFNDEKNSTIHELKFGTWEPSIDKSKTHFNSILNLFPAVLNKEEPSIEIKFIQDEKNTTIDIQFNSGKSQADNFYIAFQIDRKMSNFLISADKDPIKLKIHITKYLKKTILYLIHDSISEWLSQSIDLKKILYEADSEEVKITYEPLFLPPQEIYQNLNDIKKEHESTNYPTQNPPILKEPEVIKKDSAPNFMQAKVHPKLEELDEIEKCTESESRVRGNPNQKIKNPEAKSVQMQDWIVTRRVFR